MDACWYKQGHALLQQISQTDFGESVVSLWYIGQMGVIVKWRGMVLCIDPVLGAMPGADGRDRRSYPAPFRARELKADFIFCTHDHADHMHPETLAGLAQANPGLTIVVPRPLVEKAGGFGIPANQLRGARQGQKLSLGKEIAVTPVATAHENYEFDAEGNSRTLGYVIELGGHRLFHSGDTVVTEQLRDDLREFCGFDAAMLPINGRDLARNLRGIVGNMNSREACWLAEQIGADLVIPLHYDMIPGNGENPLVFADCIRHYAPGRKYHIFQLGERYLLG